MKTLQGRSAILAFALLGATGWGCTTSIAGLADTESVELAVRVTGGIAGVDFGIRMDGDDRLVRMDCTAGCTTPDGPVLALTVDQWDDLMTEIAASGLPWLGEREYGSTCCDFFHVEIGYQDSERHARASGDDGTFPPALADLARRLLALDDGILPVLVRPGTTPDDYPDAPLELTSLEVDGARQAVGVAWTGGCALHGIDLVFDGAWMESTPVQTRGWLTHDDPGDPCDARPHEVRYFELGPLLAAYRDAYPGAFPGERLVLHITAPGDPEERSIEVGVPPGD